MQKFDELVSYFNRKVSEMEIGTSYKMELLGMVTALGYAHEKETKERKTGRWIPVTERLPKVSGSYLVSEHSPLGEFTCTRYWNQGDRRGYWSGDGYSTVTAWMPLPEPWRGEQE